MYASEAEHRRTCPYTVVLSATSTPGISTSWAHLLLIYYIIKSCDARNLIPGNCGILYTIPGNLVSDHLESRLAFGILTASSGKSESSRLLIVLRIIVITKQLSQLRTYQLYSCSWTTLTPFFVILSSTVIFYCYSIVSFMDRLILKCFRIQGDVSYCIDKYWNKDVGNISKWIVSIRPYINTTIILLPSIS